MKKVYQTPCIDVMSIHTTQMLATSFKKNNTGADANVVLTREQKNSGIGGGLWEDMK